MWKKAKGKLGMFEPLIGDWLANADSEMGPVRCERTFRRILSGAYVELQARWHVGTTYYEETAIFGFDSDKQLTFWSFTSDGKQSRGTSVPAEDLHPEAIAFQAEMPAGVARMAYWPAEDGGVMFVVESRNKKGWKRFVSHHYHRPSPASI